MTKAKNWAPQSIRGKLLIAAVAMFGAYLATLVFVGKSLADVGQNARLMHVETVPLLLSYREVESAINDIILTAGNLPSSVSEEELDARMSALRVLQTKQSELLEQLPSRLRPLGEVSDQVSGYVEQQGLLVGELLRAKRRSVVAVEDVVRGAKGVDELLEDATIDNTDAGKPTADLDTLRLSILALSQAAQLSGSVEALADIDELQGDYLVHFREIGPVLARLDGPQSARLAEPLLGLVQRLSDEGGAFEERRAVLSLTQKVQDMREIGNAVISNVEQIATRYHDQANEEATRARLATDDAQKKATLSIWVQFLVLATLNFLLWSFFERRVVQRLKGMVGEISRLSHGELEVALTPGGERELAELAEAAEVFRQNAFDLQRALDGLELRNAQLAEFAYVASHDLKSPLRAIANLANWVKEDCDGLLPEESASNLDRMIERAQRMETLLEDLLRYSRVGHDASPIEEFECGALIRDIVDLLAPDGQISLALPGEPHVLRTQRPPLELVLRNLLSNALNHSDGGEVHVRVTYGPTSNGWTQIDLVDDGPGIDPEHRDKVFGLFTRLVHGSTGTGMGLALVRRTSEAVGGLVEVVERSGRGAHLRVTWPSAAGSCVILPPQPQDTLIAEGQQAGLVNRAGSGPLG